MSCQSMALAMAELCSAADDSGREPNLLEKTLAKKEKLFESLIPSLWDTDDYFVGSENTSLESLLTTTHPWIYGNPKPTETNPILSDLMRFHEFDGTEFDGFFGGPFLDSLGRVVPVAESVEIKSSVTYKILGDFLTKYKNDMFAKYQSQEKFYELWIDSNKMITTDVIEQLKCIYSSATILDSDKPVIGKFLNFKDANKKKRPARPGRSGRSKGPWLTVWLQTKNPDGTLQTEKQYDDLTPKEKKKARDDIYACWPQLRPQTPKPETKPETKPSAKKLKVNKKERPKNQPDRYEPGDRNASARQWRQLAGPKPGNSDSDSDSLTDSD